MGLRKPISERDRKVKVRIDMLNDIAESVEALTKGDRKPLANTLKYIHNVYQNGYTVNMASDCTFDFFHDYTYTKDDGMIVVEEDSKPLIVVLQLKAGQCEGEWRVYEIDEEDFKDDATLRAESQAEIDAENAYEKYYDSKTIYDDPRGY